MISYDFMPMQQPSELVDNNESILEYTSAHNHYNWADTVLQNITGFLHVLTPNGSISYCSESCTELTGYQPNELTGRSLTDYIHADDIDTFIHNFRYAFQTMSRVKIHYRLRCKNDSYLLVEFIGQPKRELPDNSTLYFFGIAQPYLSRSNGLIDSYMEIRIEYEWFKKRVYELLSTQNIIIPQQEDYYPNQYFIPTTTTTTTTNINNLDEPSQSNWKPHHYTPSVTSSTDENIPKVLPTLQVNDTVFTEKWKRRKKHNKSFDDYVCNDCGTTSSPEWRKGPNGPKTLCNACGLRWAKKNKKDLKEN